MKELTELFNEVVKDSKDKDAYLIKFNQIINRMHAKGYNLPIKTQLDMYELAKNQLILSYQSKFNKKTPNMATIIKELRKDVL